MSRKKKEPEIGVKTRLLFKAFNIVALIIVAVMYITRYFLTLTGFVTNIIVLVTTYKITKIETSLIRTIICISSAMGAIIYIIYKIVV